MIDGFVSAVFVGGGGNHWSQEWRILLTERKEKEVETPPSPEGIPCQINSLYR